MAMLFDYCCTKCGNEQEIWLETGNDKPSKDNKCEQCDAAHTKLKRKLAAVKPHGSWGRWHI